MKKLLIISVLTATLLQASTDKKSAVTYFSNGLTCAKKYTSSTVSTRSMDESVPLYRQMADECLFYDPTADQLQYFYHPLAVKEFLKAYHQKMIKEGYGLLSKSQPNYQKTLDFFTKEGFLIAEDLQGFVTLERNKKKTSTKKSSKKTDVDEQPAPREEKTFKKTTPQKSSPKSEQDDWQDDQLNDHFKNLGKSLSSIGESFKKNFNDGLKEGKTTKSNAKKVKNPAPKDDSLADEELYDSLYSEADEKPAPKKGPPAS